MSKYIWRKGSPFSSDPQEVGEELEYIRDMRDGLRPEEVVYEASDPESPLHPEFEWNDSVAAHQYRKGQARKLIRSIKVVVEEGDETPSEPVEAFVHVVDEEKGSRYDSVANVMKDEKSRDQVLERALKDLKRIKRKYRQLTELANLFGHIETVIEKHEVEV